MDVVRYGSAKNNTERQVLQHPAQPRLTGMQSDHLLAYK